MLEAMLTRKAPWYAACCGFTARLPVIWIERGRKGKWSNVGHSRQTAVSREKLGRGFIGHCLDLRIGPWGSSLGPPGNPQEYLLVAVNG